MKRHHSMPFGAELEPNGRVRFRLWAPAARRADVCLEEGAKETLLPMAADANGWFTAITERAGAGSRYRYLINGELRIPDPASRFQPADAHGPSQVLDPRNWSWQDGDWRGRPWQEAVIYELHVGTFSPAGNFAGIKERLDYLVELGVTAIELMPLSDFPGGRNWGYDGVLPFAPDSSYGSPDDLKDLIQAAHRKSLMVFLDVVYNHFGPDGNFLHAYAPQFFTERYRTPWGSAINFAGDSDTHEPDGQTVRSFFIHNALYWLEEYHFDGLRLDAVHTIMDDSSPNILQELAAAVRLGPGRERHVHLILENNRNAARYLGRDETAQPREYTAQWNDDIHHVLHILLTGETDGYYADYADRPIWYLGRCLSEGFGYQGEISAYHGGEPRGEPSNTLPPCAFVSFLQNHDQVGNRAFGERISALADIEPLRAALAILLVAPAPPLLFMGEEFAATQPFQFFCDFHDDLAVAVTAGRRREFARFQRFADPAVRETIPDPNAAATFDRSKLDWSTLREPPRHDSLEFYRTLLVLRRNRIVPYLGGIQGNAAGFRLLGETGLRVQWQLNKGSVLTLLANLGDSMQPIAASELPSGDRVYLHPAGLTEGLATHCLPRWSVAWFLREQKT